MVLEIMAVMAEESSIQEEEKSPLEKFNKQADEIALHFGEGITNDVDEDLEPLDLSKPKEFDPDAPIFITENGRNKIIDPKTGRVYFEVAGAQMGINVPLGLEVEQFKDWVKQRAMQAKSTLEFFTPDTFAYFRRSINDYQFQKRAEGPGIINPATNVPFPSEARVSPEDELKLKADLIKYVESLGNLSVASLNLSLRRYEDISGAISYLNSERLNNLIENNPGIMEVIADFEKDNGAYFRLIAESDATRPNLVSREQVKAAEIRRLVSEGIVKNEMEARGVVEIAEDLCNVFLISSHYAGLVEKDAQGNNVLVSERIMNEVDSEAGGEGFDRFYKNEVYWNKLREARMQGKLKFVQDPTKPDKDKALSDPATNGRRLMYFPEELAEGDFGNAESLRYTGELYLLSVPHFFGKRTLHEFLDYACEKKNPNDPSSSVKGNTDLIFRWGNNIKGAGEASNAILALMEEPLKGGEAIGDPGNFKSAMENVINVVDKYKAYLYPGYKKIFALANARIIESVVNYANSDGLDRKDHFPKWPKLGTWFRNQIVDAFAPVLLPKYREETKKKLSAEDLDVIKAELKRQGLMGLWDLTKKFWGYAGQAPA
ncbi:hypothetical protein HY389_02170 [Candidatus Daviesbacteria bacterium]|nr:hypothetical protein [Candidatus Daviesbacteria bacterium]